MDRKSGRIDPQFDELVRSNVLLEKWVGNLKMVAVFSMHLDSVNQLVAIGKSLRGKLFCQLIRLHQKTLAHEMSLQDGQCPGPV